MSELSDYKRIVSGPLEKSLRETIRSLSALLAQADAVIDAGGEPSPQCNFEQYIEWSLAARTRHAERHGLPVPAVNS